MTNATHLGQMVLRLRAERDWTQAELAEKAGVHYRTIQDVERRGIRPRMATCIRIARALEVPVDDLLADNEGTAA